MTLSLAHAGPRRCLAHAALVLRAAFGLFLHGLAAPGSPAAIERASGRVVRR